MRTLSKVTTCCALLGLAQADADSIQNTAGPKSPNVNSKGDVNIIYEGDSLPKVDPNAPLGTFPGETWKKATTDQLKLFVDKWCTPKLSGFTSTFRIDKGQLYRQNFGGALQNKTTEWLPIDTYVSNRGMFKLDYTGNDWPSAFIRFDGPGNASFYENVRFINDDGSIEAGEKILSLSCKRCRLENSGMIFYCEGDEGY